MYITNIFALYSADRWLKSSAANCSWSLTSAGMLKLQDWALTNRTTTDGFCQLQFKERWHVSYGSLITSNISSSKEFICFWQQYKIATL